MRQSSSIGFAVVLATGMLFATGAPTHGFGTINSSLFGQNAEHEQITKSLAVSDSRWDPLTTQLIAGNDGNYGGVGAPDRLNDSNVVPVLGLGPGYKHCDDGDYLSNVNYPQSEQAALDNINRCVRYYQELLERAVDYAGALVVEVPVNGSNELRVNDGVFTMTSGATISPDHVCRFRYSMTADVNAKCDVINGIGRALHLAEDFWSHTNWGDLPNPLMPIGTKNPPGLGNTQVPAVLHFPTTATLQPGSGVISGCDDSATKLRCINRIGHSAIAKDNGVIDVSTAVPNSSYPRGQLTVNGQTNFYRAVTGAKLQVATTLQDFEAEILAHYGTVRGGLIMAVLQNDSRAAAEGQASALQFVLAASTAEVGAALNSVPVVDAEFVTDPTADAQLGSGDKYNDPSHSSLHHEDETIGNASGGTVATGGTRQSASHNSSAEAVTASSIAMGEKAKNRGNTENKDSAAAPAKAGGQSAPTTQVGIPVLVWALLLVFGVVALAALAWVTALRRRCGGPGR